jgi:predicted nucleotidyltransferase
MEKLVKEKNREKIREVLVYREEVRFAYLFGSRIEGVSRPESDLDLAIYLDKERIQKMDPLFETRLALEIEKVVYEAFEMDILVLNRASLTLKYQATDKGELIYYRDEAEARDYEALVRKKYIDFSPMRKEYNEERRKRYGVSR